MRIDRDRFFAAYTGAFGAIKASQKQGLNDLLAAAEGDGNITDIRWLAYMFATVKHECGDEWQPIREYSRGKGRPYGEPVTVTDSAGKTYTNVYYGRGFVQLTWKGNYQQMGTTLKNRMLYEPDLALNPEIAYQVMSLGMRTGSFTGKKLANYIHDDVCDYVNARRIINGTDQAQRIAGYAVKLEAILRASVVAAMPGVPVPSAEPVAPVLPVPGVAPSIPVVQGGM
ncbi:MAG TPA: glycoside hydrolase family 19 protein [Longimicrobium sp.]|jgi:hypothetical protein|uniref:glycoside hydrolase family 19 protein n=1 Tax=Longimicrobium sp. TaxID=2029185 RepID=UPI002ED89714